MTSTDRIVSNLNFHGNKEKRYHQFDRAGNQGGGEGTLNTCAALS